MPPGETRARVPKGAFLRRFAVHEGQPPVPGSCAAARHERRLHLHPRSAERAGPLRCRRAVPTEERCHA
jgi:hypothetical protein